MYTSRVEERYPPSGEFLTFEGGDLHVARRGEGSPVLMIHGASANMREFMFTLAPHLEDDPIEMIMVDRPGHGYSERISDAHELGRQARAMAAVIEAGSGEPVVIVGHSFGGAVALRFALDYPELTRGLVLLAPVTHDWGSGGVALYNKIAAFPALGHVFSQFAPLVGPDIARSSLEQLFSPAPVPDNYAENLGVDLLFRPPNFRANARDVVNLQEELQRQQVRYSDELTVPVILFSGSFDTVIKPSLHAARLRRDAPDHVVLVPLEDEGHMPHHAKAELIADTIARLANGESVQITDFLNATG